MNIQEDAPLYAQVAEDMRERIRSSDWPLDSKIPTENELCDLFHVSRITVRKAIAELKEERLLISRRPVGTFVCALQSTHTNNYTVVKSFTQEMQELGVEFVTSKVDVLTSHADADIAKYLHIQPGDRVIILRRLRGSKNKPFAYFETYFKFDDKYSLKSSDYAGSFYEYLKSLNIMVSSNREIVEATLPSQRICHLLKISATTPILKRYRFTSDEVSNFYEYTKCYYIGDQYSYFLDFGQN